MKINVGQNDRIVRYALGLAILAAGYYFSSYWGLIGIVPLITGTVRWCPAYVPFRISTNKNEKTH